MLVRNRTKVHRTHLPFDIFLRLLDFEEDLGCFALGVTGSSPTTAASIGGGETSPSTELEAATEEQLALLLGGKRTEDGTSTPASRANLKDIDTAEETGQRSSLEEAGTLVEDTDVAKREDSDDDNDEVTVAIPPGEGCDRATVVEAELGIPAEELEPPTREG